MSRLQAALRSRESTSVYAALALFLVYALTMSPDVTFWDAGEFIAAIHSLGVPHPPGTPLFVLVENVWAKLLFFLPYAVATNTFSAVVTAIAGGLSARLVQRATGSAAMAVAAALVAGGMSSVWLNATETEVYAASLLLGVLMIWSAERAGREDGERWTYLTVYLMALAVPLHLSALVVAPVTMVLAGYTPAGTLRWRRVVLLLGAFVLAMGVGKMSVWLVGIGVVLIPASYVLRHHASSAMPARVAGTRDASFGERQHASVDDPLTHADADRITHPDAWRITGYPRSGWADSRRTPRWSPAAVLGIAGVAFSALLFMYVRAQFDPGINQGNPETWRDLADVIARRQYAVSPMWPREAPAWVQLGNLGQYADWQVALSLGPNVLPSILRTLGTILFLVLGYDGALALWRANRRFALAVIALFLCGALGVLVYLNLHAGPSIGYGILPPNAVREARERDYFFVFGFWAWGLWAGVGCVSVMRRLGRPAWAGVVLACLPIALNWRAVTRRGEPEQSLPRVVAAAFLESAPRNAVLFVMGDNDTYPLWYAQQVLGIRRDVAVVTVPLLPTEWARAELSRRYFLLTEKQIQEFEGKMVTARMAADGARRLGRPVVAAITMRPDERAKLGAHWTANGLAYVESPAPDRIDGSSAKRNAEWVNSQVPNRAVRDAIDPVNSYFRSLLDCPAQFANAAQTGDVARLDSVCNYR